MGVLGDHTGIKLNTKVPRMIQEVRYWSWGGHIIHTTAGALLLLLPFSKRVIQKVVLFFPLPLPFSFFGDNRPLLWFRISKKRKKGETLLLLFGV